MSPAKTRAPSRPRCLKCGSHAVTATSSQQKRFIGAKQRLVADVTCDDCGHSWWSYNRLALKMAKDADVAREQRANGEGEE